MPDSGEAKRLADKDPSSWGVEEVVSFIKEADPQALAPHADTFRKHVSSTGFFNLCLLSDLSSDPYNKSLDVE